jgi:hypothetical protein
VIQNLSILVIPLNPCQLLITFSHLEWKHFFPSLDPSNKSNASPPTLLSYFSFFLLSFFLLSFFFLIILNTSFSFRVHLLLSIFFIPLLLLLSLLFSFFFSFFFLFLSSPSSYFSFSSFFFLLLLTLSLISQDHRLYFLFYLFCFFFVATFHTSDSSFLFSLH